MTVQTCAAVISSYLAEPYAALLNGILYGIPLKATPELYRQLKAVGLLHLVVLSGTNITIVGNVVSILAKGFPKRISLFLGIGSIIAFTLFVGPQPPVVRSAIMGSLSLMSTIFGKRNTALVSLLVALILIAAFQPAWLTGLSLQLSAGATLGIILFGGHGKGIKGEIRTSLAAQVFTAPLIFFVFREVSFISPLANLLVSFLVAPLMIFGTFTTVLGFINHSFGTIPSYICLGLLYYMVTVIRLLSQVPFAYFRFRP